MLENLRAENRHLEIHDVRGQAFQRYGNVLEDFQSEWLAKVMENFPVPEGGNRYVPSVSELEEADVKTLIEQKYYGGMDCQIGYCNGSNSNLGGLEYHKGSEINVAITDMVLLVGHLTEVKEDFFDTTFLKAFYVPKGTAIEMYQTTLHLAPCKVTQAGFKCVVILPKGTNIPLQDEEKKNDPLLFMKNKWLFAHEEHERFVSQGAHIGIRGPNVFVQYKKNSNSQGGGRL
ncbi:DUF4867 family protein [Halobacillus sp. Marseille-Q1614]|uniref:DUF4867 family protein n=1 Tax=Halobacillus sp. Marseille-Q1614 TaxID=2709134 RepID=UPI00156F05B5|nr:DUF4867 family protein [Halobacillus sp. Marseille-Q1614]